MSINYLPSRTRSSPYVDHEPFVAEEADECQIEFPGELDSQAGGDRNTGHDGKAGDEGLLDDFETPAAAHE